MAGIDIPVGCGPDADSLPGTLATDPQHRGDLYPGRAVDTKVRDGGVDLGVNLVEGVEGVEGIAACGDEAIDCGQSVIERDGPGVRTGERLGLSVRGAVSLFAAAGPAMCATAGRPVEVAVSPNAAPAGAVPGSERIRRRRCSRWRVPLPMPTSRGCSAAGARLGGPRRDGGRQPALS
ncbi:MAG: hypothetical protein L6367_12865 [Cellulomonas sp.]|nr:hypothetical protein [Cellulomonas sp.]